MKKRKLKKKIKGAWEEYSDFILDKAFQTITLNMIYEMSPEFIYKDSILLEELNGK
jgi:hypothetical protein